LHTGRYAYAARFRDGLEARRDVHTIPKDVTAFGDNVTLVDADAIVDAGVRRHASVAFGYPSLHFCRTAQSVDYAPELRQESIASRFDDPTAILTDFGVDQFAPMRLQPPERSCLVGAHEAAIPRHISVENGGQSALDASQKRRSLTAWTE
jgi:hypothetical protein